MKWPWITRARFDAAQRLVDHLQTELLREQRGRRRAENALEHAFNVSVAQVEQHEGVRATLTISRVVMLRWSRHVIAEEVAKRLTHAVYNNAPGTELLPPPKVEDAA